MTSLYIAAAADYLERIDDVAAPVDLKPLVVDAVGTPVRRIGRFIQLALIGAGRCANQVTLPKDAAVYLGSGRGDLDKYAVEQEPSGRGCADPVAVTFQMAAGNEPSYRGVVNDCLAESR